MEGSQLVQRLLSKDLELAARCECFFDCTHTLLQQTIVVVVCTCIYIYIYIHTVLEFLFHPSFLGNSRLMDLKYYPQTPQDSDLNSNNTQYYNILCTQTVHDLFRLF